MEKNPKFSQDFLLNNSDFCHSIPVIPAAIFEMQKKEEKQVNFQNCKENFFM